MSKVRIEYPFILSFQKFKQARSLDVKKDLYKSLLESLVKFNIAFHISWILKYEKDNIPLNIRVQMTQLFQKPPSLGFCNTLSTQINQIILKHQQTNTLWIDFAIFFSEHQDEILKLIRIRNQDAHASIKIGKTEIEEIKDLLSTMCANPIFRITSLIIADASAITTNVISTKGLERVGHRLVIIKPKVVYNEIDWVFEGNELCLFPILIAPKQSKNNLDDIDLFFWNQRNGMKGVYQPYLNLDGESLEVLNITELSGFPYEDWKKTANPVYLNYLKCRALVLEEMLDDVMIDVHQWYDELLLARRLELEVKLNHDEIISDFDFGYALSKKMNTIKEEDTLRFFHTKLIELGHKELSSLTIKQKIELYIIIYNSIIFLFKNAVYKNDKDKYNNYFKEAIYFIPRCYYLGLNISELLEKIIDVKSVIKIRTSIMIILYLLNITSSILIGYFGGYLYGILSLISLFFFQAYAIRTAAIQRIKLFSGKNINIFNIKYFVSIIRQMMYHNSHLSILTAQIHKHFYSKEFIEVIGVHLDYSKEKNFSNYFPIKISDFQAIVIRLEFLNRKLQVIEKLDLETELYNYTNSILDEYAYFNSKREMFLLGQIECNSEEQRQFALTSLNTVFYIENCFRLHIWAKDYESQKLKYMDDVNYNFFNRVLFLKDRYLWDNDRYNFFFGAIAVYKNDLKLAINYWMALKQSRSYILLARYNIAMCNGALGNVNDFYNILNYLSLELEADCPEEVIFLIERVNKWIENAPRKMNEYLNSEIKYSWKGEREFTIFNLLPYSPQNLKYYKIYYSNKDL